MISFIYFVYDLHILRTRAGIGERGGAAKITQLKFNESTKNAMQSLITVPTRSLGTRECAR
jgi:hypothetical protein